MGSISRVGEYWFSGELRNMHTPIGDEWIHTPEFEGMVQMGLSVR